MLIEGEAEPMIDQFRPTTETGLPTSPDGSSLLGNHRFVLP